MGTATIMDRAEAIAWEAAGGPVAGVRLSKLVRDHREPGRLLRNPYRFAVYYNLPGDQPGTAGQMAPTCLELTAAELLELAYL